MPWRRRVEENRKKVDEVYLTRAVLEAEIAKSMVERQIIELKLEKYLQEREFLKATGNPIGDRLAKRIYQWEDE